MPRKKIDGVIEAVRYLPEGGIDTVRLYERRGAIWSDHILLDRNALVERLEKGKKFMTGSRKKHLGSMFETESVVVFDRNIVRTDDHQGTHDLLTGVPIF